MHPILSVGLRVLITIPLVVGVPAQAQSPAPSPPSGESVPPPADQGAPPPADQAAPPPPQAAGAPVFKPEELEQMVAPIALYPDALLAQILMAATYPLEIVEADRWAKRPENQQLKGDQLADALQKESWDPSVKSLVPFPQVLGMMSEKLDWTQRLGDAVLAQQPDVMEAVQRLRQRAQAAGTLKTTEEQKVVTEEKTVVIQPANPQTVYVPVYNPSVAYGTWPYPSYPPVYYPPPPAYYPFGSAFVSGIGFATGVAVVGSIWGWGGCNWHGNNITVNNNVFNSINRGNIETGRATRLASTGSNAWQFQPNHRHGVAFRDPATRQTFQRTNVGSAAARQQFRGFSGTSNLNRGTGQGTRAAGQGVNRQSPAARQTQAARQSQSQAARQSQSAGRQSLSNRQSPAEGRQSLSARQSPSASRPSLSDRQSSSPRPSLSGRQSLSGGQAFASNRQPSAFSGMQSGRSASVQASRGQASRQASVARSAPQRSGGGAAARGGGGGRGGRR